MKEMKELDDETDKRPRTREAKVMLHGRYFKLPRR
jgi:hypothetical protein